MQNKIAILLPRIITRTVLLQQQRSFFGDSATNYLITSKCNNNNNSSVLLLPKRPFTQSSNFVSSALSFSCFVRRDIDVSSSSAKLLFNLTLLSSSSSLSTSSSYTEMKPNVIFVIGPPGAGKGTQCQKLADEFGHVHLSAGELLRQEMNTPNSEYGETIKRYYESGTIVPVFYTCSLLARSMAESGKSEFLIDGYPRNLDNLTGWNQEMGDKANVKLVLFLNCDEDTGINRCLGRNRGDDNSEFLKKRLANLTESGQIVEHYRKLGLLVEIDANREADEVFEEIKKHMHKK